MITSSIITQRFLSIAQIDSLTIQEIELLQSPQGWLLKVLPKNEDLALEQLSELVRIARSLCPLAWVDLAGEKISVDTIGRIDANIYKPIEGQADKSLRVEKREILTDFCKALIHDLTRDRTVFVFSSEGVYLECHYQQGVTPLIPPEDLLNRPLQAVIGKEPAEILLIAIQKAIAKQSVVSCEYWIDFGGERRQYQASIYPNSVTSRYVLSSIKRIH